MEKYFCGKCERELPVDPLTRMPPLRPCPNCLSLDQVIRDAASFEKSNRARLGMAGEVDMAGSVTPLMIKNPPVLYPPEIIQDNAKYVRLQYNRLESPPFKEEGVMVFAFGPNWECRGFGIGKNADDALTQILTELGPE